MKLERKAASTSPESGLIGSDDATGVVEAIVSVTGVVDEDRDVIEPGAYAKTLARRRPKGIFAHDWGRWVARTEHIEELKPGDDRLPKQTKDGKPWPPAAGGLYVRSRFNLETTEGGDAYKNVKFFSENGECDWSIGFRVPQGAASRSKATGHRHIKELDLYEYSPVLFGAAGSYSGTLSVKALDGKQPPEPDQGGEDGEDDPERQGGPDETDAPVDTAPAGDGGGTGQDDGDGTDTGGGDGEPEGDGEDAEAELHRAGLPLLDALDDDVPADVHIPDTEDIGDEGEEDSGDETEDGEPEAKRKFSGGKRRQLAKEGNALPDGSYPIATVGDLKNAVQAFGRAKPEDRAKVKAHIIRRAKALGRTDLLPPSWGSSDSSSSGSGKGGKKDTGADEVKGGVPGVQDTPGDVENTRRLKRWYVHGDGAAQIRWGEDGDFMRCVRIARKHMEPEKAKGFCANRHKDALGVWPGKERPGGRKDVYDPSLETGPDAGTAPPQQVESALCPYLPGTAEELRDKLTVAATKALDGDVQIAATWPDRVVVTRYAKELGGGADSFEVPYEIKGDRVELGDPEPVQLTIFDALDDAEDGQAAGEPLSPYPVMVDKVTEEVKALLAGRALDTKAGRVLSNANAKRLKAAVEQLVTVLHAAGIDVSPGPEQQEQPQTRPEMNDSTAPSARGDEAKGVTAVTLDPRLQARAYRIIADARAGE